MTYASTLDRALLLDVYTSQYFIGVFASDTMPRYVSNPVLLICNTDPQDKTGTHWIAIFIDKFGRGEFFDSYGMPPVVKSHYDFLQRNCATWTFNTT